MNTPLHLAGEIIELSKIQQYLQRVKKPDLEFDYHSYMLDTRKNILDHFELPEVDEFTKLLDFAKELSPDDVDAIFEKLESVSRVYKVSSDFYEVDITRNYINKFKDPNELFGILEVTPHPYMFFVYTRILFEKKDTIKSGIASMRAADDPQLLDLLSRVAIIERDTEQKDGIIRFLLEKGVKYINEFLCYSIEGSEITSNKLVDFWDTLSSTPNHEEYEEWFDQITNILMNELCLVVNNTPYRIIECEIYFWDKHRHQDIYTHRSEEQKKIGQWYFNGYGLDITFGNPDKNSCGGILLRGVKKLGKESEYFSGPAIVLKELVKNLGVVIQPGNGLFLQELFNKDEKKRIPVKSKRIGLKRKNEDLQNFIDKPYRYIVELDVKHKFKNKSNVIKEQVKNDVLKRDEVKNIMGYTIGGL
jgi:hypothetical protein